MQRGGQSTVLASVRHSGFDPQHQVGKPLHVKAVLVVHSCRAVVSALSRQRQENLASGANLGYIGRQEGKEGGRGKKEEKLLEGAGNCEYPLNHL